MAYYFRRTVDWHNEKTYNSVRQIHSYLSKKNGVNPEYLKWLCEEIRKVDIPEQLAQLETTTILSTNENCCLHCKKNDATRKRNWRKKKKKGL